jgi:hypothetical protein
MDKALEVFTKNQQKNGDSYTVNIGFWYYYSASEDKKKAVEYANKALSQAPNEQAKSMLNEYLGKMK